MADVIAKASLDGMEPKTIGAVTLAEVDLGVLTSIAPYKGQAETLGAALGLYLCRSAVDG